MRGGGTRGGGMRGGGMRGGCWMLFGLLLFILTTVCGKNNNGQCRKTKDGKCVNGISDHVYADVYKYKKELDLDDKKIQMIKEVSESPKLKDSKLIEKAKASAMNIGPHLAYRYFVSGDWQPTFHGVKIEDAIVETVNWRHDFGVASIKTDQFTELIEKGVAYTSYTVDKFGRVILYFKLGRNVKLSNNDIYLKLLIYTIERADRMSVEVGSGEFIAVIDLDGMSMFNCPPVSVIKEGLGLLKRNYPYRLSNIFVVNAGTAFMFIWNIIKPLIPQRALKKTMVLEKKEMKQVLDDNIGLDSLETVYGGPLNEAAVTKDVKKYLSSGFWDKK